MTDIEWSDDRNLAHKNMWDAGFSQKKMAQEFGVSISSIAGKRRRLGLEPRIKSAPWSDEEVADLKQMWAEGLSGSIIVKKLSEKYTLRTRCAILGRVHRMGLSKRETRVAGPRYRPHKAIPKQPSIIKQILAQPIQPTLLPADIPLEQRKTFLELEIQHCRFPYLEGPAMFFCGALKVWGHSYCGDHLRIAYEPARKRT